MKRVRAGTLGLLEMVVTVNTAIAPLAAKQSIDPVTDKTRPPAPWTQPLLSASEVSRVFLDEWLLLGNRGSVCAAIAPTSLGKGQGAKPRRANFGTGAWAIAYDKPGLPGRTPNGSLCANCGRGAFGIAGTSSDIKDPRYRAWPFHREWADGSRADYGLEGGESLPYLAYLEISGQRCLYNVWSFLGRDHLEHLLNHLRFIDGAPGRRRTVRGG